MGKPGNQINTGRPEDEDGEALLHSVTHARQCRRPDRCLGIWDPSEAPSTPEIGLSSRHTWVQGLRGRVLREDNEAPMEASPPFPLSLLGLGLQMEDAGRILLWPP